MSESFTHSLQEFGSINLSQLNASASFLKRIDTKYLITGQQLHNLLGELQKDFHVLEINGKRIFGYDNIYMDTPDYHFYHQHQNKAASRTKIRTRLYTDSDLAFFEYKQKENGVTKKFRYQFPTKEHGKMTKGKTRFFEGVWQSIYQGQEVPSISPAIQTTYNRLTLVAKNGEERLTIDFNISTLDLRHKTAKATSLKNLVIVESKSMSTECKSAGIMKKYGIGKAKSCSKYSLGVVYSGLVEKWDTFQDTMEKIKEIRTETLGNISRKKSEKSLKKELHSHFVTRPLQATNSSIH